MQASAHTGKKKRKEYNQDKRETGKPTSFFFPDDPRNQHSNNINMLPFRKEGDEI